MGANSNLSYGLNREQKLSSGIRRKSFFLGTGNCLSVGVLGEETEIRCMVCHLKRHLHFSHTPLGFLQRVCVNKTVFFLMLSTPIMALGRNYRLPKSPK